MNAQTNTQHTPGPLMVLFGGQTCSLYFDKKGEARAKDRILQLPRDNSLGDADPNVQFVRNLAAAPEMLEALRELSECRDSGKTPPVRMWDAARAAIAKATGAE